MNIEEICKSLPSVTEDIKWEDHLCFNIGGKMFFIAGLHQSPVKLLSKQTMKTLIAFQSWTAFNLHLTRYKWIQTSDVGLLTKNEWKSIIRNSYDLIRSKLPKKVQKELACG